MGYSFIKDLNVFKRSGYYAVFLLGILPMDAITKSLLSSFAEANDLNIKKESLCFEHFCNYSIVTNIVRTTFEIELIHCGGGNDCGIDGCAIIVNGKLIEDKDDIDELIRINKYLDVDIVFIQAKTTSSFDSKEMGAFFRGVKCFINNELPPQANDEIKVMSEIWNAIIEKSQHMVNRNPSCRIEYVCTGTQTNDSNIHHLITKERQEIESLNLFGEVAINLYGASDIVSSYRKTINKLEASISMMQKVTLPEIEGVGQAYLGILPFEEFLKIIQDDNQTIHSIFDDNIRDFQGENEVNTRIKESLRKDKGRKNFCLLNNGVTIVSSQVISSGNRLTLKDYQVVNGCQTSNILHECRDSTGMDEVFIPVKIIETENEDMKSNITYANNSQTAVKAEQLQSLNRFQRTLEIFYPSVERKGSKLYYERRSQQYNSDFSIKKNQIVTIPVQIKAFASAFLSSPHLVSGYYGTIVNRFKDKMFLEEHKPIVYYASVLLYQKVAWFLKYEALEKNLAKAKYQIVMISKMLALGIENPPLNSNDIERKCRKLIQLLDNEEGASSLIKNAQMVLIKSGINKEKTRYKAESDNLKIINYLREKNIKKKIK